MSALNAHNKPPTTAEPKQRRIRLAYLDGIRGLAALYVVLAHIHMECIVQREISPLMARAAKFLSYGEAAVAVFIVLSGYCLMLPVVQSGRDQIPGGVTSYLKRRARRILPPYYFALLLSLLLLTLTLSWQHFTGFHWDRQSATFQPGVLPSLDAVITHFLLIHNLNADWAYTINGPMWTVATEWQIYFVFPSLLLPLYRHFGVISAVVISFFIGFGVHYLVPDWTDYTMSPWFLGLFALGMMGAHINFSKKFSSISKKGVSWGIMTAVFWYSILAILILRSFPLPVVASKLLYSPKLLHSIVGIATATLMIYCTNALSEESPKGSPGILQLLESRYIVALGTFSYSLYLIHGPIVVLIHQFLLKLHLLPSITFLTLLVIAVPVSILISYIFHLNFEKPFMSSYLHKKIC